jgi:hypothetical protein
MKKVRDKRKQVGTGYFRGGLLIYIFFNLRIGVRINPLVLRSQPGLFYQSLVTDEYETVMK